MVALLLLALSVSCQLLDDAARARFDLILKDFGFSETSRATVSREEVQGDTRGLTGDPQVMYGVMTDVSGDDRLVRRIRCRLPLRLLPSQQISEGSELTPGGDRRHLSVSGTQTDQLRDLPPMGFR